MRYYFDVRDGAHVSVDDIGVELPDDAAAKLQATLALTEMAHDDLPDDGNERSLFIQVRDAAGPRFELSLEFDIHVTGNDVPGTG
jgi:hypothetical protein